VKQTPNVFDAKQAYIAVHQQFIVKQ